MFSIATYRGSSDAVGILVRSWNASGEGGAAIVYDFERRYLEAIFEGDGDMGSQSHLDETQSNKKRIGGDVDMREGDQMTVRHDSCSHMSTKHTGFLGNYHHQLCGCSHCG